MAGGAQEKLVRPPVLARMLLSMSGSRDWREAMLGDLEEEFAERARRDAGEARAWYFHQALSSITPLLRHQVNQSTLAVTLLVLALSGIGFICVMTWEMLVARNVARWFAYSFRSVPLDVARVIYVGAQMLMVGAAALLIALLTFRPEHSILRNMTSRLGILACLVLAPQFVMNLGRSSLDSLILSAGAMIAAIAAGAALATRIAGGRR